MCVGGCICFPGRDGERGMNKSTVEMRMGMERSGNSGGNWLARVTGRVDILSSQNVIIRSWNFIPWSVQSHCKHLTRVVIQ